MPLCMQEARRLVVLAMLRYKADAVPDPDEAWIRPRELCALLGLHKNAVTAACRALLEERLAQRREYLVPAVRGRGRRRKTSSAVVEYRLTPRVVTPLFLVPHPVVGARVVRGRCSAGES